MISIGQAVAVFLVGIAVGMGIFRFIIARMLDKIPYTMCDYCEWAREKKNRH